MLDDELAARRTRNRRHYERALARAEVGHVGPSYLDPTPLLALAARKLGGKPSAADIAHLLHVQPRTVQRWRSGRTLAHWLLADRAAVALGLHPLMIWLDYYDDPYAEAAS
jgi:hypothetical protein